MNTLFFPSLNNIAQTKPSVVWATLCPCTAKHTTYTPTYIMPTYNPCRTIHIPMLLFNNNHMQPIWEPSLAHMGIHMWGNKTKKNAWEKGPQFQAYFGPMWTWTCWLANCTD